MISLIYMKIYGQMTFVLFNGFGSIYKTFQD